MGKAMEFVIMKKLGIRGMSDRSTHEQFQEREGVNSSSNRSFGIVFTIVFSIVGLLPLLSDGTLRWWAMVIAVIFLASALLRPRILTPLNKIWTRFGLLLHHVVNPVIMAMLFFLVVTPIGLLMRMVGKRPLNIEYDLEIKSYWIERDPPGPEPDTMKQQF